MFKVLALVLLFVSGISSATSGLLPETQTALEEAERLYGQDIYITSAYRTPEENSRVGGVPHSYHLSGKAVDVRLPKNSKSLARLVWAMTAAGFKGFGCYSTHLHFDLRTQHTFWKD